MTNYEKIYEIAADNYGLITSAQAKQSGISDKEMCAIASRGRMNRLGRGVYKICDYIPVKNDPYAEAVALVGDGSCLYGESVLGMLNLMPFNPNYIYIATHKRVRKKLPSHIRLIKCTSYRIYYYEGIPSQKVYDAILSCISKVEPSRLAQAINNARKSGFINLKEQRALTGEINKCRLQTV